MAARTDARKLVHIKKAWLLLLPVQAPWFEDWHEQPQTPGRRLQLLQGKGYG